MARKNRIKAILLLPLFLLLYQNCGSGEFPLTAELAGRSQSSSTFIPLNPTTGTTTGPQVSPGVMTDGTLPNKVSDCFTNANFNTCLFWKNPIASNGAMLSQPITANSDLATLQTHAVQIENADYDQSGLLKNSSIDVTARTSLSSILQRVSTATGIFKYHYGNDSNHRFSQVMAFYWINTQIKQMQNRVGNFFARNRNITVISWYPNLDNAFWSPTDKLIVISNDTNSGAEFSLGAEIYLHEMGHANFGYATNFAIYAASNSAKTRICSQQYNTATCCNSNLGCVGAIDEGQADYHAAMLFPTNTALGEALVNNVDGFSECGVTRKIDNNVNLTANQSYNSCGNGLLGEVHLMGRVYASIWWEVRKQQALISINDALAIDRLFNEHLAVLGVADSFVDALTKVKALDTTLFSGKYSTVLQNEFARRGIVL